MVRCLEGVHLMAVDGRATQGTAICDHCWLSLPIAGVGSSNPSSVLVFCRGQAVEIEVLESVHQ